MEAGEIGHSGRWKMAREWFDLVTIRAAAEAPAISAHERRLKDMLLQLLPTYEAAAGFDDTAAYEPSVEEIEAFAEAAAAARHARLGEARCIADGLKAALRQRQFNRVARSSVQSVGPDARRRVFLGTSERAATMSGLEQLQ